MTSARRVRRRSSIAALAGALVLSVGLTSTPVAAEPSAEDEKSSIEPADPLLGKPLKGAKAVTALGDELAVAADRNELGTSELRTLLRSDDSAWVDTDGQVFFVERPSPESTSDNAPPPEKSAPLAETFALHSNPGASRTILLDFDGADVTGTAWNTQMGVTAGPQPAWDPAGNGASFTDTERLRVQQIWAMVAEDYAPFDVDVTTEDTDPGRLVRSSSADSVYGTRVLISPSDDAHLKTCSSSCGGIAYRGVFDLVQNGYQPAWVFPQALGNDAKNVAEASSHEAGHNLGLLHDGSSLGDYYSGHGVWAPIMGAGYGKPLVQWSAGTYGGANNQQDDVAVLTGYLGARADEASGSVASPSPLPDGERIIGTRADVDSYLLGTCADNAEVTVSPAGVGANLDVRAVLYDATGTQRVVSQPASGVGDGTSASGLGASAIVPGGGDGWVLTVEGVGQGAWGSNGYDDYGSLGAYSISAPGCDGALAGGVPDAPSDAVAGVTSQDSATFTWSAPPTPTGGPVTGYAVTRSGSAAAVTLPSTARSHTFTGLAPGTTYQLSVRAINAAGTGPSVTVSATTAPQTPAAPSAPRDVVASYDPALKQIDAWWTEPVSSGTQPIAGYDVLLDGSVLGRLTSDSRGVSITNDDGFSEGQHTVGIAAVNAVGSSPVTSTTVVVDLDRPANDDVADAEQLSGTSGSVAGDNTHATKEASDPAPPTTYSTGGYSVWYQWTPSADGQVRVSTSGGAADRDTTLAVYTGEPGALVQVAGNDDSGGLHAAVTLAAKAGTRYLVVVDGFSYAGGAGPFTLSWDQTVPKPPGAPGSVSASPGDRSATVTWTAPDDNGSAVTEYRISDGTRVLTAPGTATSLKVTGLTNGRTYDLTLTAVNVVGEGAPSAPVVVTPAGRPSTPARPSATAGTRYARITWKAPSSNGAAITSYKVRRSDGTVRTVRGTVRSYKWSSLKRGKRYSFRVYAVNRVGTSGGSSSSSTVKIK